MNPLQSRLASLRRRLRLRIGWHGSCALAGLVIGGTVAAGLADWFLELPSLMRALALVALLGAAGLVAYRALIMPLAARCDDLSLALQIEEQFPELNDALASTVQFLEEPENAPLACSASVRRAAIQRTLALTEHSDFNKILKRRGLLWMTAGAVAAALAAGHFLYHHTQFAQIALWRFADPFGNHTWTRIDLEETPHRIAQGQPFVLKGQIAGIVPAAARLEVEGTPEKILPIKSDAKNPHSGTIAVRTVDMTQQKGKFRFRIHANDGVYPAELGRWHEVEVCPPPRFAPLNGLPSPQLELRYPAYTDLPSPVTLTPGTKLIQGVAGTHVTYRAAFDRPLENAWIEFRPEIPAVRIAAMLAHLGHRDALVLAGSMGSSHAVWGRVYARFDGNKEVFAMEFVPWVSGTYILHVEDNLGLKKDFEADVRVRQDPVPIVQLQKPATSTSVVPDAEIAFKMFVSDEEFAVRTVFIEFRAKDADNRWLDDGPRQFALYDHEALGKVVPRLLSGLAASPVAAPPLRLRAQNLEIVTKWALKNRFKEGETIVFQVGADDFCDLFPDRPAGRSHEIELHIVGREEIARILDEGLGKAQQELVRLQQMQDDALNLIKEIQLKKAKNKFTQKDLDQLIEAEQLQKQIQERLGNRAEEGLRDELAKLQQLIKDNKLPRSDAQDQIKTLKNELERLAQEDLQQIEPNLAEARKEMAGGTKTAPKGKGPLDKAQKLQEQAKKTLDELARFLDPWASMHQITGETRAVLSKQKELKKDVEKILDSKEDLAKNAADVETMRKASEELKGELDRKGDGQKELADRTQKLLEMMDKAQAKRTEKRDQDGARKLQKAATIGKQASLPAEMRHVAEDIKNNHPNDANRQQRENITSLEKMLAALEERKQDDLDRLQKKQKNAAAVKENLDQLAKDQDTLQKKAKEANKIDDPDERARELKKLAEEQENLKDEAQKNARELARLQEEQAAKALNRAAQEMEKAAQKLEDGQNPEDNQQEALDRMEDAQAKLQDFEEELAREQLAKIADRIKGLKERQDAALDRTQELHKKVMAKNKWSTGLVDTLGADLASQQGLAGETRSLKEKIKEAKVFEHVFAKAAKAMDDAAAAMGLRKETVKKRSFANPEQKEFADLDKEEIAEETKMARAIENSQALAGQRLQRLLDALKNDPGDVAQNDRPKQDQGDDGGGAQPRMRAGDGIPPVAQLKVLRAEQVEINERTKEFARQNPDQKNLNEDQRKQLAQQLAEMEAEQGRLHRLFEEMTAAADKKGDMP